MFKLLVFIFSITIVTCGPWDNGCSFIGLTSSYDVLIYTSGECGGFDECAKDLCYTNTLNNVSWSVFKFFKLNCSQESTDKQDITQVIPFKYGVTIMAFNGTFSPLFQTRYQCWDYVDCLVSIIKVFCLLDEIEYVGVQFTNSTICKKF